MSKQQVSIFMGGTGANTASDARTNLGVVARSGDTMTGNLNVAATLITQNVIPNANITYDLGSNEARFKDLWLSNSTIYLGEASISAQGGNVSFGNAEIQLSNVTTKLNVTNDLFVSGNVGIGTTNPGSKLHVIGVVDTQGLAATGGASLGYAADRWMVQFEGGSVSRSYACGADASTRGTWEHYAAESDGNPLLVFAAAASGKVGIGTNTFNANGGKLQVADGISFPATQSALSDPNTLDDYEEGTWTPSYAAGSIAGTGITYDGQYTKIGRVVHLSLKISATVNDLQIGSYVLFSGLPYTLYATSSGVVTSEDPDITSTNGFCHAGGTTILIGASGSPASTQTLFCTIVAFV